MAYPQLLATAVVFLCGNLMGAFHKHHMQDASHDLFTYTVKCIQIRRKLRIEKRQQVRICRPLELPPLIPLPSPRPQALCPFSDNKCVHGAPDQTPVPASPGGLPGHGRCVPVGWCRTCTSCWEVHRAQRGRGPDAVPPVPACQENLLLSVLPAHISMGMKLAIIERLKERGDRRYLPDNNFHNLYVKRHQNVRWVAGRPACPSVSQGAPYPPTWRPRRLPQAGER